MDHHLITLNTLEADAMRAALDAECALLRTRQDAADLTEAQRAACRFLLDAQSDFAFDTTLNARGRFMDMLRALTAGTPWHVGFGPHHRPALISSDAVHEIDLLNLECIHPRALPGLARQALSAAGIPDDDAADAQTDDDWR